MIFPLYYGVWIHEYPLDLLQTDTYQINFIYKLLKLSMLEFSVMCWNLTWKREFWFSDVLYLQLVLFFLPASAVIPLHNHPEMTVFSKLLLGKMHIKAYDWVDSVCSKPPSSSKYPFFLTFLCLFIYPFMNYSSKFSDWNWMVVAVRLARLKANSVFTAPCNTSVLYPTSGGNIHEFTAITPCAVLDILGPPYSKEDGRDCSYYKEIPYISLGKF